MRLICSVFVILACSVSSLAQDQVIKEYYFGGLVRSLIEDTPLSGAYVLLKNTSGDLIAHSTTDDLGEYKFSVKSSERVFFLEISFLGYETHRIKVDFLNEKTISNVGILHLKENQMLQEAIVTTEQLIKSTESGYLYDVSRDTLAGETKILNLLGKLPFIEIGLNNKPSYFGRSANIVYLLNGKRSILFGGSDLVIKIITGKNIKSIELIPNPLPPYDKADAVINIITGRSLFEGVIFGTSVLFNSSNILSISPEISITGNNKKNSFVLAYNNSESIPLFNTSVYTLRNTVSTGNQVVEGQDIETVSENRNDFNSYALTASYSRIVKMSSSFSIALKAYKSSNYSTSNLTARYDSSSLNNFKTLTDNRSQSNQYSVSLGYSNGVYRGKEFNINYTMGFNRVLDLTNQENIKSLETVYTEKNNFKNLIINNLTSNFNIPVSSKKSLNFLVNYSLLFLNNEFKQNQKSNSFLLKYTQNDLNIETGYSFIIRKKTFSIKGRLSYFNYFGDNFYDKTEIPLNYSNLHFSPSVSFSVIPGLGKTFKIGYSQLILKPSDNQLSPYIDDSNPLYWQTGNPQLKPSVINFVDINFGYQQRRHSITCVARGSYSSKPIQSFRYVTSNGVHVNTFQNLGEKSEFSLRLYYKYLFSRKFDISSIFQYSIRSEFLGENYIKNFIDCSISGRYSINTLHRFSLLIGTKPGNSSMSSQSIKSYNYFENTLTYSGSSKNMKFNYMLIINNIGKLKRTEKSFMHYQFYNVYSEITNAGMTISMKLSYLFGRVKD